MAKSRVGCALVFLIACSGGGSNPDEPGRPDAGAEPPAPDAGEPMPLSSIGLPQAVGGALWANPLAQAQVPLHIELDGDATSVTVRLDGVDHNAADPERDRTWTANLPLANLDDGVHTVTATALGTAELSTSAALHIGRAGVQLTDITVDGNAGTPRLHRVGAELWLTWTDGLPTRSAWLRKLDGAGNWVGERVRLVGGEAEDVLAARTAVGASTIAVLFQRPGGPYQNFVTVLDHDGTELLAPIPLDPGDAYGSYGGDLRYDGSGYVVVWRVNNGSGTSHVRWLRIAESDRAVTGPAVVAAAGDEDPHGGFLPITFVSAETAGDRTLVSFVRDWYDPVLELAIPKCQVATVDASGAVVSTEFAGSGGGFFFDHECRLFRDQRGPILVWSSTDLTDPSNSPPTTFFAARAQPNGTLDPARGIGAVVLSAPMHRTEPFLRTTGDVLQLAWLDERSHANPLTGKIELYSAAIDGGMTASTPVVLSHARFIAGTSQLRGAAAGSNTALVWIDDRHGAGLANPQPEIYFDTVWQ